MNYFASLRKYLAVAFVTCWAFTALSAVPIQSGAAWVNNFVYPLVQVVFQPAVNVVGVGGAFLGSASTTITNDWDDGCGDMGMVGLNPGTASLEPFQTYCLSVGGTNAYAGQIEYCEISADPPTLTAGKGDPNLHYRLYVMNIQSSGWAFNSTTSSWYQTFVTNWVPFCSTYYPGFNTEADGTGCISTNASIYIQVRPDGPARPMMSMNNENGEDAEDSWSRDEPPIDAKTAPGDGQKVALAAGMSTNPAVISFSWNASLGRLWNGQSAGQVRLLATALSDGLAYTPACLNYASRSADTNEITVISQNDGTTNSIMLEQIMAPQTLLNVNLANAAGAILENTHGVITNGTVTSPGGRYDSPPTILINDSNGSNAVINAQLSSLGVVTGLTIVNGGTNYTTNATISIGPPVNSYTMDFYLPSVVTGTNINGFYAIGSGAAPFVTWWVDSPVTNNTQWRLREIRNGAITTSTTLVYNPTNLIWTLTQGSGTDTRIESRAIATNIVSSNFFRQETQTIQNSAGVVSDQTIEMYQNFPFGFELVAVTNDPAGSDLVTLFNYSTDYTNGNYGQLTLTQYPDGYWEERLYGQSNDYNVPFGQVAEVINPWLNSTTNDDVADCLASLMEYDGPSYQRTVWHGVTPSFTDDDDGYNYDRYVTHWEGTQYIEDECADDETIVELQSFGAADAAFPVQKESWYYGANCGHLSYLSARKLSFRTDTNSCENYDYEFGQWTPETFTFSTLTGYTNDVRQATYNGTFEDFDSSWELIDVLNYGDSGSYMLGLEVVPFKSTEDVKIFQNGWLAARETYLYVGDGSPNAEIDWAPTTNFTLLNRVIYQRDCLGHATNVYRIDPATSQTRVIYQANWQSTNAWPGDLKLSDTDQFGVTTSYTYDSLKRVATKTKQGCSVSGYPSQGGIVTSMSYDTASRVLTNNVSVGGLSQKTVTLYDLTGRLSSMTTPNGLTTLYSYSDGGAQTNITFSSGTTEVIANYADRRLASITGNAVTNQFYSYSLFDYADGEGLSAGYDNTRSLGYWPENATIVTLGSSNSARWTEQVTDKSDLLAEEARPSFGNTNVLYKLYMHGVPQVEGTTETAIAASGGGPTTVSTSFGYDLYGAPSIQAVNSTSLGDSFASCSRVSSNYWDYELDASGWFKVTSYYNFLTDYDPTPTLVKIIKERATGFSSGQLSETQIIDAFSNLTDTNITINVANATVTTTVAIPQSTLSAISVAVNGLLQTETTPTVSFPTWHYYDALGRETSVRDPLGNVTTTTYNPTTGQVTSKSDPAGNVTSYSYYAAGGTNAGLPFCQTDPNGNTTYSGYDGCGRLIHKWGSAPYPEELVYDQYGDLTALHTFRGGAGWTGNSWPSSPGTMDMTTWQYDGATGLLTNKTDASGQSTLYNYYNNWQLQSCTWARGESYTNFYDELNDLTEIDYSDGSSNLISSYDRSGEPRFIGDASGYCSLTYDVLNRITSESWTNGLFNGITISNNYDPVYGRNKLITTGLSSTLETDYGYDAYGRMNKVSSGGNNVGYGYLPNSDLLQYTSCSNGSSLVLTTSRQWNYGFRLAQIANVANGATVTSHAYLYDNLNRRTQATLEDGSIWKYAYNNRNELTGADRFWSDWTPVTGQQYGYGFDNIGNRTNSCVGSIGNMPASTYAANDLDEYTNITTPGYKDIIGDAIATNTVTVNGALADRKAEYFHKQLSVANSGGPIWQEVTNASGIATNIGGLVFPANSSLFTYDADGNLTFDGIWFYSWDAKNRLTQMTMTNIAGIAASNCLQLAFSYDYMDRRIGKIVSTNSGGTNFVPQSTNYFVCDGWNLIATFNPANTIQQSFVWGVDLSRTMTKAGGIGGLLSISNSATNYFPSYDGNGNITGLINGSNDSTSALYEYGPFGELIRATGPLAKASSFRFSTKFRDDESGLVYYGSRYYNPTQGRWIGRDSAGENAGINLYLFVSNLPLTHYDTLGNVDYSQFQQLESEVRAYINKTSFSQPCTLALMVVFHGGNGIYDFAHGVHAGESFDIGNEVVDAGQAGNFLAGYAGGYAAFNGGPFSNPFAPPLLVFGGGAYYGAGDIAVSTFSSSGGGLVAGIKNYIGSLDMQWNGYVEGASDALVGQ